MAVAQGRSSNLSGAFRNIQSGLEKRADLEERKPSVTAEVAKTLKGLFTTALQSKIQANFADRNKVTATPEMIQQFGKESGLDKAQTSSLVKQFAGKKFSPTELKSLESIAQEASQDARVKAARQKILPGLSKEDQALVDATPDDKLPEVLKQITDRNALNQRISGLPPEQQEIARAAPETFFKERAKAEFAKEKPTTVKQTPEEKAQMQINVQTVKNFQKARTQNPEAVTPEMESEAQEAAKALGGQFEIIAKMEEPSFLKELVTLGFAEAKPSKTEKTLGKFKTEKKADLAPLVKKFSDKKEALTDDEKIELLQALGSPKAVRAFAKKMGLDLGE